MEFPSFAASQPKPAHPPDELISLTIPRQAFEQVFQQLLVLTKMMALAGQKASQDVQGGAGPGIPRGGGPSPAVMGLAQKLEWVPEVPLQAQVAHLCRHHKDRLRVRNPYGCRRN